MYTLQCGYYAGMASVVHLVAPGEQHKEFTL